MLALLVARAFDKGPSKKKEKKKQGPKRFEHARTTNIPVPPFAECVLVVSGKCKVLI